MLELIEPKINDEHVIVDPNFHDFYLTKVELLPGKIAKIALSFSELSYEIILYNIEYLNCSSFKEGNIVLDIVGWSGSPYQIHDLRNALNLQWGYDDYLKKISRLIGEGNLTLFLVNPSYGCELVAVCDYYKILKLA